MKSIVAIRFEPPSVWIREGEPVAERDSMGGGWTSTNGNEARRYRLELREIHGHLCVVVGEPIPNGPIDDGSE